MSTLDPNIFYFFGDFSFLSAWAVVWRGVSFIFLLVPTAAPQALSAFYFSLPVYFSIYLHRSLSPSVSTSDSVIGSAMRSR